MIIIYPKDLLYCGGMDFSILRIFFAIFKISFLPQLFVTFCLTVYIYICYNLYKEVIIIYTDIDDIYTVKNADFGESYGYISNDMLEVVLTKLSSCGRIVLCRLLHLLDTNNDGLIGTQAYRRIIPKNQSEIAEIIGVDRKYLSKAIANLEENNIVKYKNGVLMINPLVFSNSNLYDIRVLEEFNLKYLTL